MIQEEKHPDIRMAEALERIAECMVKLTSPLFCAKVESSDGIIKMGEITVVKN